MTNKHKPFITFIKVSKMEKYISIKEAARIANVHPQTIRNWIKWGKLRAYQPGNDLKIKGSDLEDLFQSAVVIHSNKK